MFTMLTGAILSVGMSKIRKQEPFPMADKCECIMPDAAPSFQVRCVLRPESSDSLLKPLAPARHKRQSIPKASPRSPRKETFDMKMQPKPRRHRRCFSEGEKARVAAVRKAGACQRCHTKHRKVHDTACAPDDEVVTDS